YPPPHSASLLFPPPPPPALYTLSLHDALPIFASWQATQPRPLLEARLHYFPENPDRLTGKVTSHLLVPLEDAGVFYGGRWYPFEDRKSTRLNSSHSHISYAVFCLKKKKRKTR